MVSTQEQETLQLRALNLQTSIKGWIKAHFPSLPSLYGLHTMRRHSLNHLRRVLHLSTTSLRKQLDPAWVCDRAKSVVGADGVSISEAVRVQHGNDESAEKGEPPDVVVFPASVEQGRHYSGAIHSL